MNTPYPIITKARAYATLLQVLLALNAQEIVK